MNRPTVDEPSKVQSTIRTRASFPATVRPLAHLSKLFPVKLALTSDELKKASMP